MSNVGKMPFFNLAKERRLILVAQLPLLTEPHPSQEFQPTLILFSTLKLSAVNEEFGIDLLNECIET